MKHWSYCRPLILAGAALLSLGTPAQSRAQTSSDIRRVADLNPGAVGSFPSNLTVFADALYLSAYTQQTGRELWKTDGATLVLATNINDTVDDIGFGVLEGNDSIPDWPVVFGEALYFSAFDPRRGGELWSFDGTNGARVADINPDPNDIIKFLPNNSWPRELTVLKGVLYFAATDDAQREDYELWQFDGAAATLVTNIHPGLGTNYSSYPNGLTAFSGALYFMADDGVNGFELWRHSDEGTALVTNINPGDATSSSYPKYFTPFRGELFFQAFDDAHGFELWKTDGTTATLVTNLNAGSNSSFPNHFAVFQDALYFQATDGAAGIELWKYDGSLATPVTNLNLFGDSFPKNFTVLGDELIFAADDGVHGWELWRHDGSSTAMVTNLNSAGDSFPEFFIEFDGALYFVATTPETGYEYWRYAAGVVTVAADIHPGPGDSFPRFPVVFNHELYFSATDDGFSNWELWALTSPADENLPPEVTLVSPTNTAAFSSPADMDIEAVAHDSDGSISRVDFYAGTEKIGQLLNAPYVLRWTNVTAGTYELTARAIDNEGALNTSLPVTIVVTNVPAAPVRLENPGWIDGAFVFSFATTAGATYAIQFTEELGNADWSLLETVTGTGEWFSITNTSTTATQRFFRVESIPAARSRGNH